MSDVVLKHAVTGREWKTNDASEISTLRARGWRIEEPAAPVEPAAQEESTDSTPAPSRKTTSK